ncbi:LamG-like jellyroll fold domain-containing protein [Streptomyces sp. 7-21]|uniref:LamG-like jellyroll fold domain-containing protein n=1 Tax=Streptomyces sp. 7-21 TaxID=2802283 RepID=UPI00191CA697|nr:LamG-like jellyroll fold domain-containing protein [Streptomyces sp. 7-21]MBL1066641.1 DNRLRE domain-containing protein [Streptomyces sp. 7-21]
MGSQSRAGRGRRGWRARAAALAAGLAVAAGLLGVPGSPAQRAGALTPPVSMTADTLPTWQTNGIVYAMAEAGGLVFVGGTFSAIRPPGAEPGEDEHEALNFAVFDAATGEPADCQMPFTVGSGTASVRALAVSPDGETLYVGGTFGSAGGSGASSLAAVDIASCTREPFPVSANGMVRALAVTEDRVYLGGNFTRIDGTGRSRFAAVTRDGDVVDGWVADADEPGKAVEVTPDGEHVLLGGDFFTVNGENSHALAVVDADTGEVARAYPLGFIERASTVQDITTDDTGFYTGHEGTGSGVFDGRIALDLDTFDERWRDTCLGATQAVAVHDEVLYSGHHAHNCASMGEFPNQERYHLFAQSVHDPKLLGWFPNTNDGLGEALGPRTLAVAEDVPGDDRDYLWVGGGFTTVNGEPQWGLTRFATGPDTGAPSVPEAHARSLVPGEIELTWRPSLDLDDSLLTYRVYRDGAPEPVHTVDAESVPWRRPQLSFTDAAEPGETHSYRITATDGAGNTSALSPPVTAMAAASTPPYAAAVLADDPLLYWPYDETAGNFASDASGNGSAGAHRGGPQRGADPAVPGPQAAAVGYDGTDAYTYNERPYSGVTEYTLETWFRTTTDEGGKLIGMGDRILQDSYSHDNNLYMLDDGRLRFGVYNGTYRLATSSEPYNDGEWHHAAASIGPRGLELYVDGELVASNNRVTSARNLSGYYWRTGGDALLRWPDRPASDYFDGQLDETAVYGEQLPAARISAHLAAASEPVDSLTSLDPVADTYVNGAAPSAVYGTHQQLAVRGDSPYESYLRFEVPQPPAGTELKSATLWLGVSSEDAADSADDVLIRPVEGDWSEEATSYATRPALGDDVLATASGPLERGSVAAVPLPLDAVADAAGGTLDLALTAEGTDSLWLWAREASGSSAQRPRLDLLYGAP